MLTVVTLDDSGVDVGRDAVAGSGALLGVAGGIAVGSGAAANAGGFDAAVGDGTRAEVGRTSGLLLGETHEEAASISDVKRRILCIVPFTLNETDRGILTTIFLASLQELP